MKKKDFIIQSNYEEVARACRELREFCVKEIKDKKICDEAEICLTESLNNIIKHAYNEINGNRIEIYLVINNNYLIITLCDRGEARTNFEKPKLEFDPDDLESIPESGMGLFIIEQLMDETNYYKQGDVNTFTMKKKL